GKVLPALCPVVGSEEGLLLGGDGTAHGAPRLPLGRSRPWPATGTYSHSNTGRRQARQGARKEEKGRRSGPFPDRRDHARANPWRETGCPRSPPAVGGQSPRKGRSAVRPSVAAGNTVSI